MEGELMTFMLGFLCGGASMLVLVVLYAALRVGGDYDAHMLPVNSDDDDDDGDEWAMVFTPEDQEALMQWGDRR
jgi:hypothetical protein